MDVWSLEELQTLLCVVSCTAPLFHWRIYTSALNNFDFSEGKALFEKYGPSPGFVIDILTETIKEDAYEREVNTAAATLASKFSAVFSQLESLDFDADASSKIFTVRPEFSRGVYFLEIPTPFLRRTFGLAMSRQGAAQQDTFLGSSTIIYLFAELGDGSLRIMPITASLNCSVSHLKHTALMAQYTTFLCLLKWL
jgi:hypothetical protein